MTIPKLIRPNDLVKKHEAFTDGQIKGYLFDRKKNGLTKCGAVIKVNRKLFIDEELFFAWFLAHTEEVA